MTKKKVKLTPLIATSTNTNSATASQESVVAAAASIEPSPGGGQPHDNVAAVQRAGAAVLHALPELGQIATIAVQAGVHMSPQAMAIAQLLQLLPMLHAAPPPSAS